jgi:26S proteasome regulatory subunit N1
VAGSEDIGNEMAHRLLNHILQFCDINIKRAVPLAVALLNVSSPKIQPMDFLLKLSHDPDPELAYRAILCMGLIGGGTNNSRIADLLHGLSAYNAKDPNGMFLVRIAQGLLHAGKGLVTF